jgi:hypothetical protein
MTGRQIAVLWYSGLWRAIVGIPLAVFPAVVAWQIPMPSEPFPNFILMAVGIGFAGYGTYLSWRAFSFLGDAITRNVSYLTGRVTDDVRTYRGSSSYFMVVGPVRTRVWRKRAFEALPVGRQCHAYYASGSLHLLSLEPATEAEPHPALRFGGDLTHAWDRLRWSWLLPAVAAFGLAAGVHAMVSAHPAHTFTVSGRISGYQQTYGKGARSYLNLEGSSDEYNVRELKSISPPLPSLVNYVGDQVDLYMNADEPGYVLAMRLRGTFYAGDLYVHPEHQYWGMIYSGAPIALLSGGVLAVFAFGITWIRRHPPGDQTDLPPFRSIWARRVDKDSR